MVRCNVRLYNLYSYGNSFILGGLFSWAVFLNARVALETFPIASL